MTHTVRTILLSILMLLPFGAKAQLPFTYVDWGMMLADTLAPLYTETIPLESNHLECVYSVTAEYPVFEPLTPYESKRLQPYAEAVGEDIGIQYYVSSMRGQGLMNVSFMPLVMRGGRLLKLTSFQLRITPHPVATSRKASSTSGRYASHSVLRQGTWRMISITEDGMYRLTPSMLAGMGFKDASTVHLYGYGGHMQSTVLNADTDFDDLEEVPLYQAPDGSLLFWGNGLLEWQGDVRVRNVFARKAYYFLTSGSERTPIATAPSYTGTVSSTVSTVRQHTLHESDDFAWYPGGRTLVENYNFGNNGSRTYTLTTPTGTSNESIRGVFTHGSSSPLTYAVTFGGEQHTYRISAPSSSYVRAVESVFAIQAGEARPSDGKWSVRIASPSGQDARLDYISISYDLPIMPRNGFVQFTGSNSRPTSFRQITPGASGADSLVVMQIGSRGVPASLVQTTKDAEGQSFATASGTNRFVAFDPKYAFPSPSVVKGAVPNQNLHAMDTLMLDMVIIVPTSGRLTAEAERLAECHRQYDGLNVAVVTAQQIYNEFSSGTPDATAYRRFLKLLYDKSDRTAPHHLRHLLLFGDCKWDNRMVSTELAGMNPDDYLLCFESDESYSDISCYIMEDYFGLLDDGEGQRLLYEAADLSIGRFPVVSETEAKTLVDKTIRHITHANEGVWRNRVYVFGDDGDNNEHQSYAERIADTIQSRFPHMELSKVMVDRFEMQSTISGNRYPELNKFFIDKAREGASMFNYTGHGAAYCLSHHYILTLDDIRQMTTDRPGLWFTAACSTAPYDGIEANLGRNAVMTEDGGALVFIGTTRTVYGSQNYQLNTQFARRIFGSEQGRRLTVGEALCQSKAALVNSGTPNKIHYTLLGDPALVFGNPGEKVVLDSLNGVSPDEAPQIKAGSIVRLKGHIENADRVADSTFTGSMTMRLYDCEEILTTRGNAGERPYTYTERQQIIHTATVPVENGSFSNDFVVGRDIRYSDKSGRFVFYAVSADNERQANGSCESFTVGGVSSELSGDTIGPKAYIYLAHEDFTDGGIIPDCTIFTAHLKDPSGINHQGNGVGHDLILSIDGKPGLSFNLNDNYTEGADYTEGRVDFHMPSLPKGEHRLTFRSWDMLNNTSLYSLRFVIDPEAAPDPLKVTVARGMFGSATSFVINYSLPGTECTFRLSVYTLSGQRVYQQELTASSPEGVVVVPWAAGYPGPGVYTVRVEASTSTSRTVSTNVKFLLSDKIAQ